MTYSPQSHTFTKLPNRIISFLVSIAWTVVTLPSLKFSPNPACTNNRTYAYWTGPHNTKDCNKHEQLPKCNTCGDKTPTFRYKCKRRRESNLCRQGLAVPPRLNENTSRTSRVTFISQPFTVAQKLTFITVVFQNFYPFLR